MSQTEIKGYLKDFVQRGRGPSKSKRLVKEEMKRNLAESKNKNFENDTIDKVEEIS